MSDERVERRLAAVLAADVAGYSRLMGADEEGTLARLKAVRKAVVDPNIASHRGHTVKTTGDGMLIEFASAVDAVRSAVEVQRSMAEQSAAVPPDQRIEFRIGIHVGDVIFDDNDIFGDGVNIAARLEGIAEPGGVCMSDDAYRQVRGKVEIVCDDMGPQPLKNIAEPMRAWRVRLTGEINAAIQAGSAVRQPQALPLPDKPSIAVLPFQNMSGDPEQEYFADGIVEDIITALSRFKSLFVIARNSSFTYKGKAVDIKQVGRELGVRYVLEGSVRKAGGRVRITGQLIEAATNQHLWADRFDGALDDIFELQDSVTASVVGVIAPQIVRSEVERNVRKPTQDLRAYDYYLRGIASVDDWTPAGSEACLQMFGRAIELDPNFAGAHARLAVCYQNRQAQGWMADPAKETAEAIRLTRRALEIAKDDAFVLSASGFLMGTFFGEIDTGLSLMERALQLNANDADGWRWSGWLHVYQGDQDIAIEHFKRALRLNPLDPYIFATFAGRALALFLMDRREEARMWAEQGLADNANWRPALRIMSAIQASLGAIDEAREITSRINPSRIAEIPFVRFLRQPDQKEKLARALRLAGVPE